MNARRVATLLSLALVAALGAASARAAARGGDAVFAENCAYCHGAKGAGDGVNAAKLTPRPTDLRHSAMSQEQIAGVVRNGLRACPSWKSSLTEDDVRSVATWTRSLRR